MHKWPVPTGLMRARPRTTDCYAVAVRHFYSTPECFENEGRPDTRYTPIRTRGATNSANTWDQVRNLPTHSPNASRDGVSFDDAVKAAGGRTLQNAAPTDQPKFVVRRFVQRPQGQPSQSASVDRARSDMVRFRGSTDNQFRGPQVQRNDRASSEGRGGSFIRGGRGGARAGRGGRGARRGGAQGPGRRQRGLSGDDDMAQGEEDEEQNYTGYYQVLTSDEFIDNFVSLSEAESYANLQEFVDEYEEAAAVVELVKQEGPRVAPSQDPGHTAQDFAEAKESALASWDKDIKEALDHVVEADELALPRHSPADFSISAEPKGTLGDVPLGPPGMAAIVEESLRYMSQRVGNHWQDPKELARKVLNGDFVKFRNLPEKAEVMKHAENFGYSPDTTKGHQHVGFEAPTEDAKRDIVKRVVEGKYADPADASIQSDIVRNAARIVAGNATVSAAKKRQLLDTIQSLLPAERGAGQARGAQKRA